MNMPALSSIHNTYFVLRHGESNPNMRGVIVSHPEIGKEKTHALTPVGEEQVRTSVSKSLERGQLNADTIIYSSPFSRCMRTAEIAREVLRIAVPVIVDARLGERWFGDWDGTSSMNYEKVWGNDTQNEHHTTDNVESPASVQKRAVALIADIEKAYANKTILLVSHGDVLQILQTAFHAVGAGEHRTLLHLTTAEIRKL